MITGALLHFIVDVVSAIIGVLPHVPVPSWLDGSNSAFGVVFQDAGLMSVWFPTTLAVTVLGAVLTIWAAGFAIKIARIIASFLTLGGGSAA